MNIRRPWTNTSAPPDSRVLRRATLLRKAATATALATIVVAILVSPLLVGKGAGSPPRAVPGAGGAPTVTVTTVAAERRRLETRAFVSGSLVAREEVSVGTESQHAKIEAVLVDEGDKVREGQVLAILSSDLDEIAVSMNDVEIERANALLLQSESAIALEEANLDLAQKALERTQPLSRSGVTSLDVLEQREADVKVANAKLRTAHQTKRVAVAERAIAYVKRRELMAQLERTRVRAPAAGIVTERIARLGDIASSDAPLFRLVKEGVIEFEALVPMRIVGRIQPHSPAVVTIQGMGTTVSGTLRHVSPSVDPSTRMARLRLALPQSEALKIGAFARAELPYIEGTSVVLPLTAIHQAPEGAHVDVVISGIVERRSVVTGERTAEQIQVLSGLTEGEQVVLRAGGIVQVGTHVRPVPAAAVLASNR
ncbi:RND family efflux transporter, MFP subunit [Rhizobium sp. CF122]|uniref:efflux RND transporter periplasmic adaptor subunit n=1 Tax=Rhizobium sp. CF122 TaxID=1144312 RepID=UPI000271CB73|nr:efflux RND transporter periplasmic adaptor subunit [Rhizobium sp. CF122]EJL51154.1 RND family efflux transporter, MFP subunit [Rhizobium sp. CF122]